MRVPDQTTAVVGVVLDRVDISRKNPGTQGSAGYRTRTCLLNPDCLL